MESRKVELIPPYGDTLVSVLARDDERERLLDLSYQLPIIRLSFRNICDLELLATGAFSPLNTFLGKEDYYNVLETMRLANGMLFPIPITLSVGSLDGIKLDCQCTLVDQFNNVLGILTVLEIYDSALEKEANLVFGTNDLRHPLVGEMQSWGKYNLSGNLTVINLPKYYDFQELRLNPREVRDKLQQFGNENVVAFQTRNPLHRAHEEMTKRAIQQTDGTLLLHPVVGLTQTGDIEYYTRVRSYKKLVENDYEDQNVVLSVLPLAMRMAGPREALWHAIIRRNFGANYLIVGRHHASPKNDSFYKPYAAQEMLLEHQEEIGVKPVIFSEFVYLPEEKRYEEIKNVPEDKKTLSISGTAVKDRLATDEEIPEWYLRSETAEILREAFPPKNKQGFCIWLTGLSGAGKSTIAYILSAKLLEYGRNISLLDGDNVRINLSKGLGFSKEDRDTNIRRIGFVASEIVKHNGAVICAAISPFRSVRNECRAMIGTSSFIEIFVDTPLDVCEQRDTKGLYSRARQGKILDFTGIDSPYEKPVHPEILIATIEMTPDAAAVIVIEHLKEKGFI